MDHGPGVDAVLPAERVLHGQPSVVELQSGESALVQADHVPMGQGVTVGVVTWTNVQRHCVTTGQRDSQVSVCGQKVQDLMSKQTSWKDERLTHDIINVEYSPPLKLGNMAHCFSLIEPWMK